MSNIDTQISVLWYFDATCVVDKKVGEVSSEGKIFAITLKRGTNLTNSPIPIPNHDQVNVAPEEGCGNIG